MPGGPGCICRPREAGRFPAEPAPAPGGPSRSLSQVQGCLFSTREQREQGGQVRPDLELTSGVVPPPSLSQGSQGAPSPQGPYLWGNRGQAACPGSHPGCDPQRWSRDRAAGVRMATGHVSGSGAGPDGIALSPARAPCRGQTSQAANTRPSQGLRLPHAPGPCGPPPLPGPGRAAPALEGEIPPAETRPLWSPPVTPAISLASVAQRAGTRQPFGSGKAINQMDASLFC